MTTAMKLPKKMLLGLMVLAASTGVKAQELEEVLVTAQKRTQSVQEVPIAISVMSAENLVKANIHNMEELSHAISGFSLTTAGGYAVPSIRGLGTIQVGASVYMGSTTYVDGVYQPRAYTNNYTLDLAESVQVLKGPQGALYGRNSTGGSIVIETRKPEVGEELTGSIKVGVGDYGLNEVSAWASAGLTDNTAFLIQGYWNERDGFYDFADPPTSGNLVGRDDPGWMEAEGINAKFLFETKNFSLLLAAGHSEQDSGEGNWDNVGDEEFPNAEQIAQISPPFASLAPLLEASGLNSPQILLAGQLLSLGLPLGNLDTPFTSINIASGLTNSPKYGETNANLQSSCEFDSPAINNESGLGCATGNGYNFVEVDNYSATMEWNLARFDVVSVTSYQDVAFTAGAEVGDYSADSEGAQVLGLLGLTNVGLGFSGAFKVDNVQQEFRLVSNDTWDWDWIVGANYFDEESDFHGLDGNAFGMALVTSRNEWQTTSWSVFGQGTVPLTDKLSLTLGARYLDDELQLDDKIDLDIPTLNPTVAAAGSAGHLQEEDNHTTYTIQLEYTNDDWMVYGGLTTGYKSASLNPDGPTFGSAEPEEVDSYEIGWKSQWFDNTLQFNGAVFYYDYQKPHISFIDNASGGQVLLNIPEGDLLGLEVDFQGLIGDNITWYANMTFTDSEYTEDTEFFNASANLMSVHATDGKTFAGASDFAFAAGLDFRVPMGNAGTLFITPSVNHNDGIWYDAENRVGSGGVSDDGFTVANLNIQYQPTDGGWSVTVWGKNLTDEEYYKNGLQANGFLLPANFSDPRTYGATLRFNF